MSIETANDTYSYIGSDGKADEARMVATIPVPDLISGDDHQRIKVENGDPAFWEGRQFRIAYEFNFDPADEVYIEVVIDCDIILTKSEIEVDEGGVRYSIISDGTPSGTFGDSITVLPRNTMSDVGVYTSQVTFAAGGTVSGGTEIPVNRVRTASGNNTRASSVGGGFDNRGFGATTLHLKLASLSGVNDDCTGILNLEWEERP